jgi:acyl-CoA thioesterase FadM
VCGHDCLGEGRKLRRERSVTVENEGCAFEHKFVRETREFERVTVRLRIADWNRKFVTLEHEVKDSSDQLLGRGKQTLLFVSSSDYRMIDLPAEIAAAFVNYA